MDEGHTDWLDGEVAACHLADERLTKRLRKLLGQIGGEWARAYPLPARTGRTPRERIAFCPMIGSTGRMPFRKIFLVGTESLRSES
jgi:hypothetical protein